MLGEKRYALNLPKIVQKMTDSNIGSNWNLLQTHDIKINMWDQKLILSDMPNQAFPI